MSTKTQKQRGDSATDTKVSATSHATLQGENRPDLLQGQEEDFSYLRMVEAGAPKPYDMGESSEMGDTMVDQMTMLNKSDDLYKRDPSTGETSVLQGGGDYSVGYKPALTADSETFWTAFDEQNGRVYDGAELYDNPAPSDGERFSWRLCNEVIDGAPIRKKKTDSNAIDANIMKWQQDTGDTSSTKSPSMALKFWLRGPTVADCASVMVALMLDTVRQQIGDAAFDKMVRSSGASYFICPNPGQTPLVGKADVTGDEYITPIDLYSLPEDQKRDETGAYQGLEPGDTVYFRNKKDYAEASKRFLSEQAGKDFDGNNYQVGGSWAGENCVYMGRDDKGQQLFSGFGMLPQTEAEIVDALAAHYLEDTGKATTAADIRADGGGLQTSKVTDNGPDGWRLKTP